jgi:hypothetical protein
MGPDGLEDALDPSTEGCRSFAVDEWFVVVHAPNVRRGSDSETCPDLVKSDIGDR